MNNGTYWAAVKVEGNRERRAQFFIELIHHRETYCPRFLDIRRSNSVRPAYPGYVFCLLRDYQFTFLRGTPAVIGPVMLGVLPNEVPEKIIKEWKSREDKHGLLLPIIHQFRPGQSVKVTHGPLKGQVGSYDQYVRADHHQIILEILGQSVKTDLSETMFEAA